MKRKLLTIALAALTIGLLGSCSKMNERIDGLDQRVGNIENEKIASIENQIAAINSSIADLGAIRKDITDQKAASETLGKRIDTLKAYVGDLSRYAEKDWATALFATLDQLNATKADLETLRGTVSSIDTAISNLDTRISALEARVSALEAMIQSVSITPAYSDGSVEAENGILTLKCIVSPAEALLEMESLKDSLLIYADSVKVKTKATTPAYMTIEVSEASVLDAAQGAITLTADISEYLPKGEDKALTVAVNIKNGISDFTTEFVPVYVAPKTTFRAVYNTNGGANTLTFYYDANDHSGEGITVYKDGTDKFLFDDTKTNGEKWGYNDKRGEIKSVVIDASVAGYSGLTSTAYMFSDMFNADSISGAEYLDVSNVTDMSLMFQKYGHESQNFNAVPDVSKWNTGNVTNMTNMFFEYGYKSTVLNTVPNVSGWNTGNVTKISSLFNGYGHTSNNIDCTLDLSGWDLSKITGTNGDDVFNFKPKTFNVTIPAKTGEKSNEGGKWYYGDGTNSIAAPAGKTFAPLPAGALKGVFTVSDPDGTPNSGDEKKVRFSQGNLQATYNSSASTYTWGFAANQYDYIGNAAGNTTIDSQTNGAVVDLFGWSTDAASNNWGIHTKDASTYTTGNFKDWGEAIDNKGTWRTLSGGPYSEWGYLRDNHVYVYGTCNNVPGVFIAPDGFVGDASALSEAIKDWESALATGILFLPAAGYRCGSEVLEVGDYGYYWSSNLYNNSNAYCINFKFNGYSAPSTVLERLIGSSVRLVTEVK